MGNKERRDSSISGDAEAPAEEPSTAPTPAKDQDDADNQDKRQTIWQRVLRSQWFVGLVLLLLGIWIGMYQESRRPLRLNQSGELSDFVITPISLECVPSENRESAKSCTLKTRVINNHNESRALLFNIGDFILYVGDNRFDGDVELSARDIFPDESAEVAIIFELPASATPTRLEIEPSSWSFFEYWLPFLRRPLIYDLR